MQAHWGFTELTHMLWIAFQESLDLPQHLHPSSLAIPPLLDQLLAEHEIKLANCSPFLCLSVFFFVSFIIMHISYARTLGTAGFEEVKLAKNNHLGWKTSTI